MKKGINATVIATAVIAVCLVAVIGVLGFRASKAPGVSVNPTDHADENIVDYNTIADFETSESSTSNYSYYYTTTAPTTFQEITTTTSVATSVPLKVDTIIGNVQEKITSAISTTAKATEKTTKPTTAATSTVVVEDATVPVLNEDELSKSSAASVKSVAAATANTDLPDDMYFAGLYRMGYDTIGTKGFIFNDDTSPNCTQRKFGYNVLYDEGAKLIDFSIETSRIKFNYDNKAYMLQIWKGQYISGDIGTVGGEVGLYTRPINSTSAIGHYNCAAEDDWLYMEMTVLWDEFDDGVYRAQLTRKYAKHWWETGYVDGQLKNRRDSSPLRILSRITFKDETQAKAVQNAMIKNGFKNVSDFDPTVKDTLKRYGKDLIFVWQDVR